MSAANIAGLLQRAIGLDISSVGLGVVSNAIQQRLKATACPNEEAYCKLLQSSATEIAALVEEVVVPETWFFRHEEAFNLMSQHIVGAWRSRHPDRMVNILSVPCSTGEEAYSIAMALMDHGLAPQQFRIDAIDVSRAVLAKARQAIYGNNSFRSSDQNFRQRYFRPTEDGYALNRDVAHTVTFHQGNILDHEFMRSFTSYDIIFCRNLLIYLDQASRERTVKLLAEKLNRDGLLFVGHAETGLIWKRLFDSVAHPMAFAYRRRDVADEQPIHVTRARSIQPRRRLPATASAGRTAQAKPAWRQPPAQGTEASTTPDDKPAPSLEGISKLADQGRLEEARQQCEAHLQACGASAQAYFLLGLISDSQGSKEMARDYFRKALYLEPNHYETLVHLSLLLDQVGDHRAAENLRIRLRRISEGERSQARL